MRQFFSSSVLMLSVILSGCGDCSDLIRDLEHLQSEFDQLQDSLDEELADKIDRNGDGKPDLFFERYAEYHYELVDRNFDGVVDESWEYDNDYVLQRGKVDENLDRILETEYVYENHSLYKSMSDTDGNGVYDVFSLFDRGVLLFSEKYYRSEDVGRIGKTEFEYGYPVGAEVYRDTNYSEQEFAAEWLER